MHYERVSLARRGGSWRMSYRAVYDAEHKGDRKWVTIGAAASRAEAEHLAAEYLYNLPRDPEDERRAAAIEAAEGHMPTVGELRQDDIDHALSVGAIEKTEEVEEPAPDSKAPRPVKIISWESLACG